MCRNFYYVPPDDFLEKERPAKEIERLLANIINREKVEEDLRRHRERLEELVKERTAEAEEARYGQQQVFRILVENSPDIIARYDRDCKRTYVNPTYLKVAQAPQQELLANAPVQRSPLPAASAAILQSLLRRVLDSGVAEAVDVIWPKAGQGDTWYNIYAFPEFDREGRVASVMTVSRDITGRKRAEETLEKERKRMEVILSALNTGLSLINPDMTIAWVNQKIREMFPGREPVGQVCHVFYESRATICDGCGTLRAFMDGKVCESEQLVPATGRWYYIISQPIKDTAGRVVNVLEGITDITERKQAEEALKQIEWMLSKKQSSPLNARPDSADDQGYGDLTMLNRGGLISKSIDKHVLRGIASEYLDLTGHVFCDLRKERRLCLWNILLALVPFDGPRLPKALPYR